MAVIIQLRRDTAANWAAANPVLASGEPGYETDTGLHKIGNGVSAWNALSYVVTGVEEAPIDGTPYVRQDADWVSAGSGSGDVVGPASAVNNSVAVFDLTTGKLIKDGGALISDLRLSHIGVAVSDETTALTTGTAKTTFRMPYAFTLTSVKASVTTAPTGAALTVGINENGSSILSTKITIDATEKTSTTATTQPVISDSNLADDSEITIDIDTVGSTVAGAGLKVWLIGYKTP